jgi:hypothetical protein
MNQGLLLCTLAGGVTLGAACASSSRTSGGNRAACGLQPGDTSFIGGGPVYRDCAVDVRVKRLGDEIRPDYRPTPAAGQRSACYAVELEFVVDTLGVPETRTARVIRKTDPEYATAVLATLSQWRYEPARLGNTRVRQITSEKRGMASVTVAAPAGSAPPRVPRGSVPKC